MKRSAQGGAVFIILAVISLELEASSKGTLKEEFELLKTGDSLPALSKNETPIW